MLRRCLLTLVLVVSAVLSLGAKPEDKPAKSEDPPGQSSEPPGQRTGNPHNDLAPPAPPPAPGRPFPGNPGFVPQPLPPVFTLPDTALEGQL